MKTKGATLRELLSKIAALREKYGDGILDTQATVLLGNFYLGIKIEEEHYNNKYWDSMPNDMNICIGTVKK